ncbi:MAG TPA: exodeoxyribonuclease VII small subunit [Sphingomonas sp.]|nr:exodeoxyribonuclease VII small subunit [Sphingomonas sp.]
MADEQDNIAELSFEEALRRLEQIVHELESGDVPLERSIDLYAEGDRLRSRCEERLKAAQARIERIQVGPGGRPTGVEPLDGE